MRTYRALRVCTYATGTTAVTRTPCIIHTPRPTQRGKGNRRGGVGGEREHFLLWKLSLLALLKRGKEEGKGGVVCPSLDSQQNKRFMGGVDSCILMENGQCFGR